MFERTFAVLAVVVCAPCAFAQNGSDQALRRIDYRDLCVTNGTVSVRPDGRLAIDTPSSRAVVRATAPTDADQVAEIRFRYLGPTQASKPLASGELRRQIGLKLRAQDTCNLVYAMWHIEPDARVAVSIKRNPGMSRHEQCDAHGYINLKPTIGAGAPTIAPGEEHTLRAELQQSRLTVIADGKVAWSGDLGQRIFEFDGPVGMRSDNARFDFAFLAASVRGQANA